MLFIMTTEESIKEKLQSASLSEYEMSLWEGVVKSLPENMLQDILEVFNVSPEATRTLTDNLVVKTDALKSGDIREWEKVLENDKAIIAGVA